jgi:hypothetical protein
MYKIINLKKWNIQYKPCQDRNEKQILAEFRPERGQFISLLKHTVNIACCGKHHY